MAIRGLLMRMGKQDQTHAHSDWAYYGGFQDDDDEEYDYDLMETWYEAYNADDYEWGWDDPSGWSATTDLEWYYMADDDIWLQYDQDGECIEELGYDDFENYYGGKGKGKGRGKGFRRFGKGKRRGKRLQQRQRKRQAQRRFQRKQQRILPEAARTRWQRQRLCYLR